MGAPSACFESQLIQISKINKTGDKLVKGKLRNEGEIKQQSEKETRKNTCI